MILSQFYIYSRGDTIHLDFEYGYGSNEFMESIVSLWVYDSISKTLVFGIRDYEFVVSTNDEEIVSIKVHNTDGLTTVMLSKAFAFRADDKCIAVCCGGYEVHRYYYV